MSTISSSSAMNLGTAIGGSSTSSTTSTTSNPSLNMTPEDFINIMVTELQNQDPLDPTSPSDLLQETSEIGQLSTSDSLQTTMQSMTLQSQIGSASSLIGKNISGIDGSGNATTGVVNSIQVQSGAAYLQLDSGDTLSLSNVTAIGASAATGTTSSSTPTAN